MVDTFIWEGESFDLPRKTLKVAAEMDNVRKADSVSQTASYRAQYKFVTEILGKENAEKILDAEKLEDVDLSTLSIVYLGIENAYIKRVEDYRKEQTAEKLQIPGLDKAIDLAKSSEAIARMSKKR
ncbi:hypothetical protein ACTQ6A_14260 [Lachnospiraceae bacterium LCP25S3_G4]